jgi:hypothetical protein
MALPGDAAALRFYNDPESKTCLIHDPHRQTLSAVLAISHPAYVLLAPIDQESRVSNWGRVIASLAQTGTCSVLQILESTIPDPGTKVAQWYAMNATHRDDWPNAEYQALLAQSSFGSSTHRTTITITLDMKRAAPAIRGAGRGLKGAAHVLRIDMSVLEHGLRAADLRLGGWLGEAQVAAMIRQAYDPTTELDANSPGATLVSAGPVALSLIFAPDIRKSLCLLARPLGTAEALRTLRKEKTEAITDAGHKAKVGQVQDLSDVQEYNDLLKREQALIGGHADVQFSGLITVTASSEEGLTQAVALIERSAGQSGCETRRLYGRQSQGFVVGALPLGRGVF